MNTLRHREGDDDLDDLRGRKDPNDREITLGSTLILGIFLGLAMLCGVFFALGYSLGHRTVIAPPALTDPQTANPFVGFKPAPGNPLNGAPDKSAQPAQSVTVPLDPSASSTPATSRAVPADPLLDDASASPSAPAATAALARPLPPSAPPAAPLPAITGGSSLVQIAAVTHQEDADLLVTTLKRRGYAVSIRSEPQDKLLHVQVGPFATHKDADAMRQRLLADGFNAIVKDAR